MFVVTVLALIAIGVGVASTTNKRVYGTAQLPVGTD
jgi:hypothetical protein